MQNVSDAHDTESRKLSPLSSGEIGGGAVQEPSADRTEYGARIVYLLPVEPTATHRAGAVHETWPSLLSVTGVGPTTLFVERLAMSPAAINPATATITTVRVQRSVGRRRTKLGSIGRCDDARCATR
jgi:hypothetical protein